MSGGRIKGWDFLTYTEGLISKSDIDIRYELVTSLIHSIEIVKDYIKGGDRFTIRIRASQDSESDNDAYQLLFAFVACNHVLKHYPYNARLTSIEYPNMSQTFSELDADTAVRVREKYLSYKTDFYFSNW